MSGAQEHPSPSGPSTAELAALQTVARDLMRGGAILPSGAAVPSSAGEDLDILCARREQDACLRVVSALLPECAVLRKYRSGPFGTRVDVALGDRGGALGWWFGVDMATGLASGWWRALSLAEARGLRSPGAPAEGGSEEDALATAYHICKAAAKDAGVERRRLVARMARRCTPGVMDRVEEVTGTALAEYFGAAGGADLEDEDRWADVRRRFVMWRVRRDPGGVIACGIGRATRSWNRLWSVPGFSLAVVGPDGSGKSTLIAAITGEIAPLFRSVQTVHYAPRLRHRSTRGPVQPYAKAPYSSSLGILKLVYLQVAAGIAWPSRVWAERARNGCVIFDRYLDDVVVDPRRYRVRLPEWIVRLAFAGAPQPDLRVVVRCTPDVAANRKSEITASEASTLESRYVRQASSSSSSLVVSGETDPEENARSVYGAVLRAMAERAGRVEGGRSG